MVAAVLVQQALGSLLTCHTGFLGQFFLVPHKQRRCVSQLIGRPRGERPCELVRSTRALPPDRQLSSRSSRPLGADDPRRELPTGVANVRRP
jgi:hypothetical protein